MSATKRPIGNSCRRKRLQRGAAAVEFALVIVAFFIVVFGVIELARLMFLFNTLQEVTRRAATAASNTDFTNAGKLNNVRQSAIFRSSAGGLVLMKELTDESIRIDYLWVRRETDGALTMMPIQAGALPSSPAANRRGCLVDPNSESCIRIVRARVCQSGISPNCEPMQFQGIVPLLNFSMPLTIATTLAKAESLGISSNATP
ncbi:TadE/TadG family type IV pilus assembly protein [Massilia psychrophila]|jgi:Flp pilus assembly protein TadG|uniref:Pilus assembly protein TadE n=1 Tax=Massilia psychrophila TaxID=1603353 RepID=A0A2G8T6I8_9BURK|nr:TadE/TadG family type IV pilus assembly protein [Massilia psychrophila]PIL41666.1 pilus assembly protein TadE [Massilia psychrophila]